MREMIRWNQAERVVPYEWQLYESLGDLLVSSQVLQVATPERSSKACIVNMNERPDFIDEGSSNAGKHIGDQSDHASEMKRTLRRVAVQQRSE